MVQVEEGALAEEVTMAEAEEAEEALPELGAGEYWVLDPSQLYRSIVSGGRPSTYE